MYLIEKKVRKGSKKVCMRDCEKRRFRSKIDDLMKKARRNRRSYVPTERLKLNCCYTVRYLKIECLKSCYFFPVNAGSSDPSKAKLSNFKFTTGEQLRYLLL